MRKFKKLTEKEIKEKIERMTAIIQKNKQILKDYNLTYYKLWYKIK